MGRPVRATGLSVTYTLTGADAGSFEIVPETGQLKTVAALDYEQKSEYRATVTATSGTGKTGMVEAIEASSSSPSC